MLFAAFYQMYCNPYLPFLSLFRYLDKYGIHWNILTLLDFSIVSLEN